MEHILEQLKLSHKLSAYEDVPFLAYLIEMALAEAVAEKVRREQKPSLAGECAASTKEL